MKTAEPEGRGPSSNGVRRSRRRLVALIGRLRVPFESVAKTVSRIEFLVAVGLVAEHAAVTDLLLCSCYVNSVAHAGIKPRTDDYHRIDNAHDRARFVLGAVAELCPSVEVECIKTVADASERAHRQRQILAHAIAVQSENGEVSKLNPRSPQPMQLATVALIRSVLTAAEAERNRARKALGQLCTLQASRPVADRGK